MATKISQLPSSDPIALTDVLPIVQSGNTKKVTIESINTYVSPEDLIPIYAQSDLTPYISAGKYAIPSGKGFLFKRSIQVDKPFLLPTGVKSCLVGTPNGDSNTITLTYTSTTGEMIQGTNIGGFAIVDLILTSGEGVNSLPAQTLFNISNGVNPVNWSEGIFIFTTQFINWSDLGVIEGTNLLLFNILANIAWGTGLLFKNISLISFQNQMEK